MYLYWIDLFGVVLPVVAVEGVVVLKEVVSCAMGCTVMLGFPKSVGTVLKWYCLSYGWGAVLGMVLEGYGPLCCFGMVQCTFPESVGTVQQWYWSSYCFSHRSCRIWKTFEDVPVDVLIFSLQNILLWVVRQ